MRLGAGVLVVMLALAGCRAASAEPSPDEPQQVVQPAPAPAPPVETVAAVEPATVYPMPFIGCSAQGTQGGGVICKTSPNATVAIDGKAIALSDDRGVVLVPFTRTQKSPAMISVRTPLAPGDAAGFREAYAPVDVLKRKDIVSKFEMECTRIAPQSPADQRKAEVSWVKKDNAMKIFSAPLAPVGLVKPAEGPYSSPFGATRTYVPKTKDCEGSTSVHNGQDIAIGTGTQVLAPMAGTVILADPDLFYEGGAVFLDMGRGLVSITMHLSRVDVKAGDVVQQGQLLGLSGATGRVTGPHLHWALKYRNPHSTDRGTDIWLDPMLIMQLKAPE